MQKVLEEANIKLGSVLSDIFGVSGQLMLEKLLEGEPSMEAIANLAQRKARMKIPEILQALEGHRLRDHHRRMLRLSLEHLAFLEQQITRDFFIEAAFNRVKTRGKSVNGYVGQLSQIYADPNRQLPNGQPNPNAGMLYTAIDTMRATASEMRAAHWAFIFSPPRSTNRVISGNAAKMDDTPSELLTGS